ncbi:MAG: Na+:solute symporter [Gemmatimonadota bacterium]|uniref:sodium:solute symporter family protein n=1 Tax=Candidatus Palauibacter scopulicola TaxID=3056741 RepID=UPI0023A21246|nr:sodium:solute symporter family protein [Candidatus Palauibacter scopulicola]MDE2661662.1 Na+:solute symporter [Candidatus Palauibacter scopulicola]
MQLNGLDWIVLAAYGIVALGVGLWFARRAGSGTNEFFLAGRKLPWWLLGTSMVATTFSTDTPNLVTDLVRNGGVSRNWGWWAFLITAMCTTFFYAKLWRRSGVFTDIGFYELRYSGRAATFLRGFRALYLGVFFNVVIMATVTLAAIKISGVLLGADKYTTVLVAGTVAALYSATSGLWGVVVTDLLLFAIAMIGSVAAASYALSQPEVGGLAGLVTHPEISRNLSLLPDFSDWRTAAMVFVIPIAVQWWASWYPGAEPGGGGYAAQRMLAARNERDSMRATLWFNIAHYSLRPWPWILVALASIAVYPTLDSIGAAFPDLDPSILGHDLAYPAMLVFLPHGLLGLVVASLAAAYMSTISTHLNWGSSYVVDDFYRRFVARDRDEAHYVRVARISTGVLIVLSAALALFLDSAKQAFELILLLHAGSGLIFLLRWFWWRVNAWSEISGMAASATVALWFPLFHERVGLPALDPAVSLLLGVGLTTAVWLAVTFLTRPVDTATLQGFCDRIRPFARGWRRAVNTQPDAPGSLAAGLAAWGLGCVTVYAVLFGTGMALYGRPAAATGFGLVAVAAAIGLFRALPRVGFD